MKLLILFLATALFADPIPENVVPALEAEMKVVNLQKQFEESLTPQQKAILMAITEAAQAVPPAIAKVKCADGWKPVQDQASGHFSCAVPKK